jgi:hypothetical protein
MGMNNTSKDLMLDALSTVAGFASLHTASPGATGTSEVTGGAPAYARKAITWNASVEGILAHLNQPVFDVPAGTTVTHAGFWSLATGGTYYGFIDVDDEVFAVQGQYVLTGADIELMDSV